MELVRSQCDYLFVGEFEGHVSEMMLWLMSMLL